jgi:hypothetical protein
MSSYRLFSALSWCRVSACASQRVCAGPAGVPQQHICRRLRWGRLPCGAPAAPAGSCQVAGAPPRPLRPARGASGGLGSKTLAPAALLRAPRSGSLSRGTAARGPPGTAAGPPSGPAWRWPEGTRPPPSAGSVFSVRVLMRGRLGAACEPAWAPQPAPGSLAGEDARGERGEPATVRLSSQLDRPAACT